MLAIWVWFKIYPLMLCFKSNFKTVYMLILERDFLGMSRAIRQESLRQPILIWALLVSFLWQQILFKVTQTSNSVIKCDSDVTSVRSGDKITYLEACGHNLLLNAI